MVQLIKPVQVKTISKEGELNITITLDLNINLSNSGISVVASAVEAKKIEKEEDKVDWAIPDFSSSKDKLNFGKIE